MKIISASLLHGSRLRFSAIYSTKYGAHSSSSALINPDVRDDGDGGEEDDDPSAAPFLGVLQDKDLLRKSPVSPESTACTAKSGLYVLDLIDKGSLEADRTLYNKLLNKCALLGDLKHGRTVHSHVLNSKFKDDLVIQNSIVNMYAKCDSLDEARFMFDEMSVRDMITWTALISGYSQSGRAEEALVLFPQMLRRGFSPNEFTFSSVLKASGSLPSVDHGCQLHAFSLKYGYNMNVYVGSSLVDMYARFGCMKEAHMIFDSLPAKNEVSWNGLIAGHSRKNEGEHAIRVFGKMLQQDFKPTHFTYSSIFTACASTGSLEQGKWVHAHVMKSGGQLVSFVGNTLLDMYAKSGSIEDAKKVFIRLVKQSVVSWNSMLTGFAQYGLGKEALLLFKEMQRVGVQPNAITFLSVLTACSHAGLLDDGRYYFNLMKRYEIEPQAAHYVTIVDLLGRAGRLDEAKEFIKSMPIEPTAAVWGALLGACRMHKNTTLGAYAADRVFELDPHDSGPHILLSNIYASAGRLNDAAKARKMMKESGVKKEPACSWVEIENSVHVFVANDDAHPQREEIRRMWEKIYRKIKEIGYDPDVSNVLYYLDEQERKVKLQYHSEKVALAFCILNTAPGSIVRIKKNIRVCGDCHSAFKFVSKVEGREIILRDTNRFHHFREGLCSCRDYW